MRDKFGRLVTGMRNTFGVFSLNHDKPKMLGSMSNCLQDSFFNNDEQRRNRLLSVTSPPKRLKVTMRKRTIGGTTCHN